MVAPTKSRQIKSDKSNAPGQLLGYGLQITRLTALLLEAPEGSLCSVEVLDDVAVESKDSVKAVQSKSALTSNPASDRSVSLWKTFATWARQSSKGTIDPQKTQFELYVSRPVSGDIAGLFAKANDLSSAAEALAQAKKALYGDTSTPRSDVLPEDLKRQTDEFFGADWGHLKHIVNNFSLVCGSGSPQADLETLIRRGPVTPSKAADIAAHMCGLVKQEVEKLLEQGQPAVIDRDEFHTKYRSYCHRIDRKTILQSVSKPIDKDLAKYQVDEAPMFIRQLMLIKAPFDDLLSAASDWHRASVDRTAWAKMGEVDEDSLDELNDTLERAWKNHFNRGALLHKGLEDADRGKMLLYDCMGFQTSVEGMQVPPYFVSGCFHLLADEPRIGWHPNYTDLLRRREGK